MTSFLTQNGGNKRDREKGHTSGWKVINTKRDKKGPVRDTGRLLLWSGFPRRFMLLPWRRARVALRADSN